MIQKILLPILILFISCNSFAQDIDVKVTYTTKPEKQVKTWIYYDSTRKLTWDDFIAKPDPASNAIALTSSGFGLDETMISSNGHYKLNIIVYCDFDKTKSWVKPEGYNDYILNHEQHHFDISYIGTMLFIKKLRETKFTPATLSQQISDIYSETSQYITDLQNQYDGETHNGIIRDKQMEWMEKIDKMRKSLEIYAE